MVCINLKTTGTFQTLPGIIPRFYRFRFHLTERPGFQFQTLPGIIPRFYMRASRTSSGVKSGFKPFQGLFRVSTEWAKGGQLKLRKVSNPSRDYSAFLRWWRVGRMGCRWFQTLPGIIPRFYFIAFRHGNLQSRAVSNPSRDYSAFLPAILGVSSLTNDTVSNPSRDYSAFLRHARPQRRA
ncbi:hypothetical protein U27_06333 [Candidatus Vecturithrix granuli]|uniref:Uncharacterized protein n=1 Tax=Vecturithrix granuli TaxID=1499967 RepID=A0A081C444_VECG1|nr:hypothetical protein U27_06333 [Candidatus Vecturithrix granuli]